MKVFVLNLARCPERMARVKARLDELGVPFERLEGIDDSQMDEADKLRSVNRFGWWCCSLRPITPGQIGCALSHLNAYRKMIDEGIPLACILEDDVVLSDRSPEVLAKLQEVLDPEKAQVALLFDHAAGNMELVATAEPFQMRRIQESLYAEGYVLTCRAAERIIQDNYPLRVLNDIWGRWVRQGRIELFSACPSICTQNSKRKGESTIAEVPLTRRDMSCRQRLWWDFRRFAGVLLDAFTGWPEMKGSLVLLRRFLKGGR